MTRDDAIKALRYERKTALHENKSAFDMAIQALEQQKVKEIQGIMEGGWTVTFEVPEIEPCDDATLKDIFCMGCEYREQEPTDHIEYGTDGNAYKLWMSNGKEFACDDAISREAVRAILSYARLGESKLAYELDKLPSVTQKSGHWIRISPAEIYECSECCQHVMTSDICAYKFCHGCGAKMVEPQESEDKE